MSDNELEVVVGGPGTMSGDFMSPDGSGTTPAPKVKKSSGEAEGMIFNDDGTVTKTGPKADEEGSGEPPAGGEGEGTGEPDEGAQEGAEGEQEGAEKEEEGGEQETLPEFDPENEETVAKWDERYFPGDGTKLDTSGFADELKANLAKEGGKAELNAGSYAYLEHRLGVDKETVDTIIAGQVKLAEANDADFYSMAGPKAVYDAKVDWGSANYSQAQKDAFNAAMQSGDRDAIQEQIDLLSVRMQRAGVDVAQFEAEAAEAAGDTSQSEQAGAEEAIKKAQAKPAARPGKPARRPSSPPKPAEGPTSPSGGEAGDGFKNNSEYVAALKAAGSDVAKQQEVAAKLRRSKFWKVS